ncbi:C3 and PZP-like alpha-2-macroglobulin domain-containing protein 8 isoform X1 [Rhopalosiphum maidis]|uniref:C3 and PZP-like alpha-2-macroglobulin domain-containing protein 8 isoform X1 n=1 Tax=Rhopalosiphum maidis TaxID=43146 RepID=UPI000EFDD535|nr:C3 and PZP-like alpha-2-macroglobulin domain-containing protein 8 isoform X1 [Rhopalosiphum maidis]
MDKKKMASALALLAVLYVCVVSGTTNNCTRTFNVVAPKVAVPGQRTAVLVSWNPACSPKDVTLRLLRQIPVTEQQRAADDDVLSHNTVTIHGDGIIPLTVPTQTPDTCYLQTLTDCVNGTTNCTLQTTSRLRLVGSVRDVVVQTSSKFYKPGETIEFWLLPLDHYLRIAEDVTMDVYIKNPKGTRVALWDDVPSTHNTPFSFMLSELAVVGEWTVEVTSEGVTFKTAVNVSNARGSTDPPKREQTITEEHFVELRFGHEMRHKYKPGLPFLGKVEAMSSEKNLRVRVKVFDNSTTIYSQDVEIIQGEGTFVVPAMLSDNEIIVLQAELVSVEGKEIEGHYVLAKEFIQKWNSTSDCYLLVEGVEHTLMANEEAEVVVLSSCPCNRYVNYVVTTEGHVAIWQKYKPVVHMTKIMDQVDICRFNLTFNVDPVMAPTSHLLVYYTTEKGETINDVISFNVKQTDPKVKISLKDNKNNWYPEELMELNLMAEENSLVCLIGGRGTENISPLRNMDDDTDLLESGLLFLEKRLDGKVTTSRQSDLYPRHHSFLDTFSMDQLWTWKCVNFTSNVMKKGMKIHAPYTAGHWKLRMLAVGSTGLKITDTLDIKVTSTLEVDVRTPVELNVGETVQTDIYVANNVNSCMDVNALLSLSEGAVFSSSNQPFVAEKMRLGAYGATSLIVRITALKEGLKNLTVDISGYVSEKCHIINDNKKPEVPELSNSTASIVVKSVPIYVHPEGIQHQTTDNAYFCANEQLIVSTTSDFRYQHINAPKNRDGIVFEIQAKKSAHILLSQERKPTTLMYQIVLGDLDNTISWIGRGKHGNGVHLTSRNTPGILSEEEPRTFWISWEKGVLAFGYGQEIHQYPLLKWNMDKKIKINHIGFATILGTTGQFRVWNYNDEAGFSQVLHLETPNTMISGSESGSLVVTGGLNFPFFVQNEPKFSTSLVSFLSTFTPLLMSEHNNNGTEEKSLVDLLSKSIPVLLSYQNTDGSFGDHPNVPCYWCDIRVLEILWRSQSHVGVDSDLIKGLKTWIQKQVFEDFSTVVGQTDIEINQIICAADTLATLMELGIESEIDSKIANHTKSYLEQHLDNIVKPYPLAITTYALMISNSYFTKKALTKLQSLSTNQESEFGWPKVHPTSDWYDDVVPQKKGENISIDEFKASLYCLMIYSAKRELKSSEPIVRYLYYRTKILDIYPELAYLAVKAFAMYDKIGSDPHRKLTISLATSGMELTDTLELDPSTKSQYLHLPSLPTKVFVYATGAGCSTIQGRVLYSTYTTAENDKKLFDLWSGVTDVIQPSKGFTDEIYGHAITLRLKTCFRMNNESEDAIRLEVKLFSGYYFDKISSASVSDVHHDSHSNHIWFVFAKVKSSCVVCVSYTAKSIQKVTGLRQAVAKVYAVSRPDQSSYKLFHVDEEQNPLAEGLTDMQIADWITNDSNDFPVDNNNPCKCNNHCEPPTTEKTVVIPTTLSTPYQKPSTYAVTTSITGDVTTDGTPAATRSTEAEEVLSKPRIATIPTKIKRTPVKSTGNVVRNMKKPNKKNEKDKDSTSKHRTSDSGPDSVDRDSVPLKDTVNTDAGTMAKMAQMNTMRNGKPSVIGGSTTKPTTTKVTTARGSNATTERTTARTTTYSASAITTLTSTKSASITPMTPTSATIASKTSTTSSPTTTATSKPSKTTTTPITTSTTAATTTTIVTPTTVKLVQATSSTTSKSSTSPATFTSPVTTAKSLTTAPVTTAKSLTTTPVTTAKSLTTSTATTVKPTVTTATPPPGTTTSAAKIQTTPVPAKPLAPSTTPVADLILEANRNKKITNDQKKDGSD